MLLIIGSYANANQPGIHLFRYDKSSLQFKDAGKVTGIENPSYVEFSKTNQLFYAIRENKENSTANLNIYQLQQGDEVALVNCIPYEGAGSCYISIDSANDHAFIANYGSGNLTVVQLPQGEVVQELQFNGSGPNKERQEQSHIHAAMLDQNERYLYCSDLGADRLYRFLYDRNRKQPLQTENHLQIKLPSGSGPRHIAFSPDWRWLYLITELSGEIFVFDLSSTSPTCIQQISLIREGFIGKVEGGDIQVHSNWLLYASNRGDANEIIAFKIDKENGKLALLQHIDAAGASPRSLLICEQQQLLLVANEQSNKISIFKIQADGSLELTSEALFIPTPSCLKSV